MDRITIDIAKEELDFIREALAQKYRSLISYLDTCEVESAKPVAQSTSNPITVTLNPQRVQAMKKAGVWKKKTKRNKIIAAYAKADAPWGLKKDGTPKKRPGRKVAA